MAGQESGMVTGRLGYRDVKKLVGTMEQECRWADPLPRYTEQDGEPIG